MSSADPSLYARSFADVYDDWYADLDDPSDLVAAFQRRCQERARIFEFGGGTGRLAAPLVEASFGVVSIDVSRLMLGDTPPGPQVVACDMAEVALRSSTADAVLIAYNTLFNVASTALQQQCIEEAARVLRPGGLLAIEAFIAPSIDTAEFGLTTRPHPTEADAYLAIVTGPDPDDRDAIIGSHIEVGAYTTCRPWRLTYQSPAQLDACAASAGFELVERHEDWRDTPLSPAASRHVSWYRADPQA